MKQVVFLPLLISVLINSALGMELLPYKNPDLSDEARVEDLLSRMTLAEKIGQMSQYVGPKHIARSEKNLTLEEKTKKAAAAQKWHESV